MGRLADFFREQTITLAGQQKAKMLSLDRQFEDVESERDSLKTENLNLKAQVKPLEREVERLKNQMEQKNAAQSHGKLDETSEKMLLDVANGSGVKADVINNAGLSRAKGEHHFDILLKRGLIAQGLQAMGLSFYSATADGRKYLADHKLI